MDSTVPSTANNSATLAAAALRLFELAGELHRLPGERDLNFRVQSPHDETFVLKISAADECVDLIDLQNRAMAYLAELQLAVATPRVLESDAGQMTVTIKDQSGKDRIARLLTYLPGTPMVHGQPHSEVVLEALGRVVALVDLALSGFDHPSADRLFRWNLLNAHETIHHDLQLVTDDLLRAGIEKMMSRLDSRRSRLNALPQSVIHNDGNDYNVLIDESSGLPRITGLIDFGDLCRSYTIGGLAVAATYAMLGKPNPFDAARVVVRGYTSIRTISDSEADAIADLIWLRILTSITSAARQYADRPDNEYLLISQQPMRTLLSQLEAHPDDKLRDAVRDVADSGLKIANASPSKLLAARSTRIGPSLSLSYDNPLTILRGSGQYLYDHEGRAFLDCVNNVCHVGHAHPDVVRAGVNQAAILNTNTRYLHPLLGEYAARLTATLPDGLDVCYFVCSGSEANELALRLARAHTQSRGLIVFEAGYHGNTHALIEASSYKFDGPGGAGAPPWVQTVQLPDAYRLRCKDDPHAGEKLAADVGRALGDMKNDDLQCAAMLAEAMPGCGGQIILPENYLRYAYDFVRTAGGVCIADEVQTGFGRPGTHFWAFETQSVVPDIVTMGKPIGNGHPIGAVVTTREIAKSFDNGMEYFNTFGGNPVSCAIGMEVLNVLERERLQSNALAVGEELMEGLVELQQRHEIVGDVRGSGLFIGVELVRDRATLEPAAAEATSIVNRLRDRHCILLSTDGPLHNVLKIKPPMVFSSENAKQLCAALDDAIVACMKTTDQSFN